MERNVAERELRIEQQRRADAVSQALAAACLPRRHACLDTPRQGEQWQQKLVDIERRSGYLIALLGGRGRGKTQMAVDLIRNRCGEGKTARYVKAMAFFLALREAYQKTGVTEQDVLFQFQRPSLLVIDAMEERGDTAWEDRVLNHLIDTRYDNGVDTLLISNQTPDVFINAVGPSIASRLNETGGVVVCNWDSYREVTA